MQKNEAGPLETILAEARAAVGDERRIARVRSITAIADCTGPSGKYRTEIDSFRGDKTRFAQTYTYKPDASNILINGDAVWELDPASGEADAAAPFQRMAARGHEYQKMAIDLRHFFSDLKFGGPSTFEGKAAAVVRAKNELGMPVSLYFDSISKHFAGFVLEIPGSNETIRNVFLEWKNIGGLRLPVAVRATDSKGDWTLRFHTVRLNQADGRKLAVPPRIADITELRRLHEQQKTAHLTYNAEMFVSMMAENLTQLQRGNAVTRSKADNLARFKAYFASFRFLEWEDIRPPVIKVSRDGTMATIIVEKRVRGTYKNDKGEDVSDHTIFAWLEVWEKAGRKWQITTVASTEKTGN